MTGAVASERVSEALKGSLRMVGNHLKSAKAEGSLTAPPVGVAVFKEQNINEKIKENILLEDNE